MSERPTPPTEPAATSRTTRSAPPPPPTRRRRPIGRRLLELLFWIAVAVGTAWLMIENVNTILPANNF